MTHLGDDVPQRLFTVIVRAVNTFLLIALFYIMQYIFDLEFPCSCISTTATYFSGLLYLFLPPWIITGVVTLLESIYQRKILSWCCCNCCNNFISMIFVKVFVKYIYLFTVWTSAILFDKDWYFCLVTNCNSSQTAIPCKGNLTYEEKRIMKTYKAESLDFGLAVISVLFIVWHMGECCIAFYVRLKRWKESSGSKLDLLCPPYYRSVYEELLSKEVSSHLTNELTKIAKERAEAMCHPHLRAIRHHEQQIKRTGDGHVNETVLDAWQRISESDFYLFDEYEDRNNILYEQLIQREKQAAFGQCLVDKVEDIVYTRDRIGLFEKAVDEIVAKQLECKQGDDGTAAESITEELPSRHPQRRINTDELT